MEFPLALCLDQMHYREHQHTYRSLAAQTIGEAELHRDIDWLKADKADCSDTKPIYMPAQILSPLLPTPCSIAFDDIKGIGYCKASNSKYMLLLWAWIAAFSMAQELVYAEIQF